MSVELRPFLSKAACNYFIAALDDTPDILAFCENASKLTCFWSLSVETR
jgi:hypothetical protein